MYKTLFAAVASLIVIVNAPRAQGAAFVNLNFEQAMIPPNTFPGDNLATALAFPGWTARVGSFVPSTVYYDSGSGGEGAVALADANVGLTASPWKAASLRSCIRISPSGIWLH